MAIGAVFFDVDGTLVPETSTAQFLAERLGHLPTLEAAEAEYALGTRDNHSVSTLDAAGWAGHRTDEVASWLPDLPVIGGIAEVVDRCWALGLAPHLATLAWAPIGAHLCATYGFDGSCGPTLVQADGAYTGEVERHFDEFDKRDHAIRTAADLGLPLARCAAIGDSRSDLALFDVVGLAIALNADPAARAAADLEVEGDDLRTVLPHLERWAAALPTTP